MGNWSANSKTVITTMGQDDFFSNEQSVTVPEATTVRIELVSANGDLTVLKEKTALKAGEVLDATVMRKKALVEFLEAQVAKAREQGLLFSLHMKATMMKVSDPIIFGHAVKVFFKDLLAKHAATIEELGVDFKNGFGDLIAQIQALQLRHGKGWRNVRSLRADGHGIFGATLRTGYGAGEQGAARARFGRTEAVPFSMRPVRDFHQPPFG